MKHLYLFLVLTTLSLLKPSFADPIEQLQLADVFEIESKVTEETITYYVSLPKGYARSNADYPTIFVLDGGYNQSHVVGSHEVLVRTGYMPPAIIVGIVSEDRTYHFAPTASEQYPTAGGAEKFTRFIQTELIPELQTKHRMNDHQAVVGHSFGGLFAAYSMMNDPDLFDSYVIIAPALWWDGEMMLAQMSSIEPSTLSDKRIFYGIGEDDGYGMKQEMKRFIDATPEATGLAISQRQFESEGHMSAPLLTTYYGFKHIFSDMLLSAELKENFSSEAFLEHEENVAKTYGTEAKQSAETYVFLALDLMEQERYADAAIVFERNADAYSDFPNSWFWLGQAYEKGGRLNEALDAYENAIELAEKGRGTVATYQESAARVRENMQN
ncbi:alpha/beta hydrolase-fold protein [Pseudidiomarina aestuarii]|uniref:alpha/beta hydrolase-fold protein n=1 Tax=Pseudidiomarina aestuarii TaxID=624146 RepID=UPI003A9807BF